MNVTPTRTLVLGDYASISADLARLWINCHEWPERRLEIVTAEVTTAYRVRRDGRRSGSRMIPPSMQAR